MKESSKPTMFRPALPDDLEHVVDLLVPLFQRFGPVYGIPCDGGSIIKTVSHVIRTGICIVGDHGCAGGFIHPYPWNNAAKIGVVLFWNYRKPSGIKVFEAIAEAFRERGATAINCSSHFPQNRAGRFYSRLNLRAAEIQWINQLDSMKRPFAKQEEACRH